MQDPIRRLLEWVSTVLAPRARGQHRAYLSAATTSVRPAPLTSRIREAEPLNGDEVALIRPYLLAHEQRQEQARQRHRRLALVLAADFGIDLDQHLIGMEGVA